MGHPRGFLRWPRQLPPHRAVGERVGDSRELVLERSPEERRRQGGRCMDCGVPFCQQGCPLGNLIPDFNDLVHRGRWREAYLKLTATNSFPELTGRLCPAPCEAACTLAINQDPVSIEQNEKEIIEHAFAAGWVEPQPPRYRTNRTVAVVGSGPAGLAAAAQLNRAGHAVTVLERDDRLGGLLRYGIPDFKLEKGVIDRRLELLAAEGIAFETGVDVGVGVSWNELRVEYDALVVCIGARRPRELDVPGRDLAGVELAMRFLEQQNRRVAGDTLRSGGIDAAGRRVIILGGGDTGSDCLGTALRQGATSVRQIELLPAPPATRSPDNPWPQWPLVFGTTSSQAEGGERSFALMTTRLSGSDGRLERLHAVEVARRADPPHAIEPVAGAEATFDVDLLLLAMGYVGPATDLLVDQLGVGLDPRGNVAVDARYATDVPGVFAAGDASRGQSLVVWAIAEGREAARGVDEYLTGRATYLPTRGADHPFGGR